MTLPIEMMRSHVISELARALEDARRLPGAPRGAPPPHRTAPSATPPLSPLSTPPGATPPQTPPPQVTITEWSPPLEHAMSVLKQWFQPLSDHDITPLLHLLSQYPDFTEQIFTIVSAVAQQSPTAHKTANLHLAVHVSDALAALAESHATAEREAAPTWTPHASARHTPTLSGWLSALHRAVAQFGDAPKMPDAALRDFLQSMHYAIREAPDTIEQEITALPVALRAGLSTPQYHAIVHDNDPMRLALALQTARTAGAKTLHDFVAELQRAVRAEQSTAPLIDAFTAAHPHAAHPLEKLPSTLLLHALTQKQITVTEGADEAVQLFAFSDKLGALPANAWRATQLDGSPLPNATKLAWDAGLQGALLVTKAFGAGLHPLRLSVRDKDSEESWIELLLYVVRGIAEEQHAEQEEEQEKTGSEKKSAPEHALASLARHHAQSAYEHATPPPPQHHTLGATLQFTLRAPHIFVRRATPHAIPAPLHVSLQFLADLVDPQTKCSREHFLRIPESPAAANLRTAIQALNAQASGAFDQFVTTLDTFFTTVRGALQSPQIPALEQARVFLRDTVLLHLSGKSPQALSGRQQLASLTPRGDVVACVFSTTAEVLAASQQYGDALIHCTNAADVAEHKPYFQERLETFMGRLRERLTPHAGTPPWNMHLPALPVPGTRSTEHPHADLCHDHLHCTPGVTVK